MPSQLLERPVPKSSASRLPDGVQALLRSQAVIHSNPTSAFLASEILRRKRAILTDTGALATWGRPMETGRIPKDTYVVRTEATEGYFDWSSTFVHPMSRGTFDALLHDAATVLSGGACMYHLRRTAGADPQTALGVEILSECPLASLFADTMLRPASDTSASILGDVPLTLLLVPRSPICTEKYTGVLRNDKGKTVDMCIIMDCERRIGLVYGTAYLGAIKKLVFTVMNVLLPVHGVLPLHCSANLGARGDVSLFLGLSGTGKTTLSAIGDRKLIGDDEHLWSDTGIANIEGGCYAKLIALRKSQEPRIFDATFAPPTTQPSVIIENAMVFPDGRVDVDDDRLTENSRSAFPLSFLPHVHLPGVGDHPRAIIFLTADAMGVLPPIALLSPEEALKWFALGYTSDLAGVEAGSTTPKAKFSRFFGAPFMLGPRASYVRLFQEKIARHGTPVYLVNTGWTGGAYGTGRRMDIAVSRAVVEAALSGVFLTVPSIRDSRFGFLVPDRCPGIPEKVLHPEQAWADIRDYKRTADALVSAMWQQMTELTRTVFP